MEYSFLLGCSVGVKVCGMVICALNFASTHQTENLQGFSKVDENQQLLIAIAMLAF